MVTQPEGLPEEDIDAYTWTGLVGDFKDRECLVSGLSSGDMPSNLTHSVYKTLWPLISSLAAVLVVDNHWLPKSNVRKRPEYICEAFQRLILQFIDSKRNEDFMTFPVGESLRQVQKVANVQTLSTSLSQQTGGLERENEAKRRRLDRTEVGRVCANGILNSCHPYCCAHRTRTITNRARWMNERGALVDCILGSPMCIVYVDSPPEICPIVDHHRNL